MDVRGDKLLDFVAELEAQARQRGEEFKLRTAAEKLGIDYKVLGNRLYKARKRRKARAASENSIRHFQDPTEYITGQATGADSRETGERVELHQDGNQAEAESQGSRIMTLEDLVRTCQIDLDVWVIEKHVINKWEVGAKNPETGEILVEPLFQVKAWMAKRHPEAIKPVISPIAIHVEHCRRVEKKRGLRSALIVPDPQFGFSREVFHGRMTPFHDRLALDVVRQVATTLEPDLVILLGDVCDFSGWSDKFIHRPEFYFTTQPALIETSWYIGQLAAVAGETHFLEGNHDQRPEKQIIAHLVDAYGLRSADQLEAGPVLSVDNLLGLKRMGVKYQAGYPDNSVWINSTLRCVHGEKVRGQPGQTAAAVVRDANESIIFGHIHRREMATRTISGRDGYRTITAYSPGCLCHVDGRVPGSKKSDQWQQGAAVVWYNEECAAISPIEIYGGRGMLDGTIYQGRDYLASLRKDSGYDFTG